ncbi:hypothetical protein [Arthrobacter sp. ZGTC131]|uniref:hypothetical protein n=1 Tax=Arthrobacter sp. ZGTC131 TaxID=2058898 RepID=UPI000CE397E4|nr:hypothetical protein [Arthrobacter sp. ZGTC131]
MDHSRGLRGCRSRPDAQRPARRNRSLFFICLLATAAGVLSLELFYLPIDRALGGMNIARLLLRLIVLP